MPTLQALQASTCIHIPRDPGIRQTAACRSCAGTLTLQNVFGRSERILEVVVDLEALHQRRAQISGPAALALSDFLYADPTFEGSKHRLTSR